jgi:hypothetical protein
MYRFRKMHLTLLVLVLAVVVTLVVSRGVDVRGVILIGATLGLVLLRWWQFRRQRPPE